MTVKPGGGGTSISSGLAPNGSDQGFIFSTLPGIFNTIANLSQLFSTNPATLPGVFNVAANLTFTYDLLGSEQEPIQPYARYFPQTDLYAGGFATAAASTAWQGTAVLANIASLLANPAVQGFAFATLPGVFNLSANASNTKIVTATLAGIFNVIANLNQAGQITATLAGIFNVAANLQPQDPFRTVQSTDSRPFVWYAPGTLVNQSFPDSGPTVQLASVVFASVFNTAPNLTQQSSTAQQATSVLPGVFNLTANTSLRGFVFATLPGVFNVVAAANAAGFAFATLPGVFNLAANLNQRGFISATLPGVFNLSASSVTLWSATTVLPGVFSLAADTSNTKIATSVLAGVFNLATSGSISKLVTAVLPGVFNVIADTRQRGFVFATLPASFDVTANANAAGQIAASLAGVFSLLTDGASILPFRTVQVTDSALFQWYTQRSYAFPGALESPFVTWQATAVLAGVFTLAVNTGVTSALPAAFNLSANLTKAGQVSATIVGNFNLIADTIQSAPSSFRTVQLTDSRPYGWFKDASDEIAGALANPVTQWQATAVLAGIFSVAIGQFSQAVLPAAFNLSANLSKRSQISARFSAAFTLNGTLLSPADFNFRTVQVTDSRSFRWHSDLSGQRPGLLGTTQVTTWQATSVLAAAFNLSAATFFAWQATARLAGIFSLAANLNPQDTQRTVQITDSRVFGYYKDLSGQRPGYLAPFIPALSQISAILTAAFNVNAFPGLNFLARATLRVSAAMAPLLVVPSKTINASLSAVFNLAANATNTKQISARLTGVFSLSGAFRTAWQAQAQLDGVFNWIATERFFSPGIRATFAAQFGLAASMFQFDAGNGPKQGGGSSRYVGNQYGWIGEMPDPQRGSSTIPRRKRITTPNLPPEAFLPPPVELPDIPPSTPFTIRRPPITPFQSPLADHASDLERTIMQAHAGVDDRDAMDVLHSLLSQQNPIAPPDAPMEPAPAPAAPTPPVSPTPADAHNAMDEQDAMAILKHLKLV
jgi:hypothetical protein